MERLQLDPTKAAALMELAHRSLDSETLEETNRYFANAAQQMERNIEAWRKVNPSDARQQAPGVAKSVAQIRELQKVLPEYFAHRKTWTVTRDAAGSYVISNREDRRVLKRIE